MAYINVASFTSTHCFLSEQHSQDTLSKEQLAQYKELEERRKRLKELERVAAKMQTKKNLTVRAEMVWLT